MNPDQGIHDAFMSTRTFQSVPKNTPPPLASLEALSAILEVPHTTGPAHIAVHSDGYSWLPDRSVDMVLTDPPFNIAQDTNFHTYEGNTINSYRFDGDKGWDSYTHEEFVELLGESSREFARVLRPGGTFAIFCADAYISHLTEALKDAGLKPRRTLTWRKPNAMPVNRKYMMMSSCEYVIVGVKGSKATFNSDLLTSDVSALTDVESYVVGDKVASVVGAAVRSAVSQVTTPGSERPADIAVAVEVAARGAIDEALKKVLAMYVGDGDDTYLRACVPNYAEFNSKAGNRLHPTEKPVSLLRYLAALLSKPGDLVLDPFGGSEDRRAKQCCRSGDEW